MIKFFAACVVLLGAWVVASQVRAQETAPPVATATGIVTVTTAAADAAGVDTGDVVRITYHGMEQVVLCRALADAGDPANGVPPSQEYIAYQQDISRVLNRARPWDTGSFTIACEGEDWVLQPFVVVSPSIAFP